MFRIAIMMVIMLTACSSKLENANAVVRNIAYELPVMKAVESVVVTATCYQPTPAQCNNDPFNTAFGYKINPSKPEKHRYLALSRDLEAYFAPGDSVWVENAGVYSGAWLVADRMNRRWKKRIDFLVGMNSYLDLYRNVKITNLTHARRNVGRECPCCTRINTGS